MTKRTSKNSSTMRIRKGAKNDAQKRKSLPHKDFGMIKVHISPFNVFCESKMTRYNGQNMVYKIVALR